MKFLKRMIKANNDVLVLRVKLLNLKNQGVSKEQMIENLNWLRSEFHQENNALAEDRVLDLLDFAEGFCNSDLSIY